MLIKRMVGGEKTSFQWIFLPLFLRASLMSSHMRSNSGSSSAANIAWAVSFKLHARCLMTLSGNPEKEECVTSHNTCFPCDCACTRCHSRGVLIDSQCCGRGASLCPWEQGLQAPSHSLGTMIDSTWWEGKMWRIFTSQDPHFSQLIHIGYSSPCNIKYCFNLFSSTPPRLTLFLPLHCTTASLYPLFSLQP